MARRRLILAALLLAGCSGDKAEAPKKRPPPLVVVGRPEVRDVDVNLRYSVDIRPIEQADLQSKVAGYVERIYVDRGDFVPRGKLLVEVRPSEIPEQVNMAREQLGQSEASFRLAEENARRARELHKRDMISKAELDQAEAQLAVAQAARGSAKSGLGAVSTRLGETRLIAPFSGWIARRSVDPGALVTPGVPILTVMRTEKVRVFVSVLESEAALVRRDQEVAVTVDALPDKTFTGKVTRVPPALDFATRTLDVEIVIPNADGVLKPGMYGRAAITVARHPGAIVLPVEAVLTEGEARAVYLVENVRAAPAPPAAAAKGPPEKLPPIGTVRRVEVKVGYDGGAWLEITSGLAPDAEVILSGVDLASDGATVSVKRAEPRSGSPPTAARKGEEAAKTN